MWCEAKGIAFLDDNGDWLGINILVVDEVASVYDAARSIAAAKLDDVPCFSEASFLSGSLLLGYGSRKNGEWWFMGMPFSWKED